MLITKINMGRWSRQGLDRLLQKTADTKNPGDRIEALSRVFLGIPYRASTLIGSTAEHEQLVVDLSAVDCFTLLDYVEALRHADNFEAFTEYLISTRYRDGIVSFSGRNHFFTDWPLYNAENIRDVTAAVGGAVCRRERKVLNCRPDGSFWLQGIPPVVREVTYIPADLLNSTVSEMLRTGDYIGVYSDLPGLDVSHVGIIVRAGADIVFRHASSRRGEVVDEDFKGYISRKPGVILLRPQ